MLPARMSIDTIPMEATWQYQSIPLPGADPTDVSAHVLNGIGTIVSHFNLHFFDYPVRLTIFSYDLPIFFFFCLSIMGFFFFLPIRQIDNFAALVLHIFSLSSICHVYGVLY